MHLSSLKLAVSFLFVAISINKLIAVEEASDMSPFRDGRAAPHPEDVVVFDYSEVDPVTGEKITTLDPVEVKPLMSLEGRVREDARKRRDKFLKKSDVGKKLLKYTGVDFILRGLKFLPTLGYSDEEIAEMHALDNEYEKSLRLMDHMIENQKNYKRGIDEEAYNQMRYDLIRMKREAIVFDPDRDSF